MAPGSGFAPVIVEVPDALEPPVAEGARQSSSQNPVQTIFGLPGMPPLAPAPSLQFRPQATLQQRLEAAQAAAQLARIGARRLAGAAGYGKYLGYEGYEYGRYGGLQRELKKKRFHGGSASGLSAP